MQSGVDGLRSVFWGCGRGGGACRCAGVFLAAARGFFPLPLRGREMKRKSCHCVAREIKRIGCFLGDIDRLCGGVLEGLDVLVESSRI